MPGVAGDSVPDLALLVSSVKNAFCTEINRYNACVARYCGPLHSTNCVQLIAPSIELTLVHKLTISHLCKGQNP